jgi:hypothetical protein
MKAVRNLEINLKKKNKRERKAVKKAQLRIPERIEKLRENEEKQNKRRKRRKIRE